VSRSERQPRQRGVGTGVVAEPASREHARAAFSCSLTLAFALFTLVSLSLSFSLSPSLSLSLSVSLSLSLSLPLPLSRSLSLSLSRARSRSRSRSRWCCCCFGWLSLWYVAVLYARQVGMGGAGRWWDGWIYQRCPKRPVLLRRIRTGCLVVMMRLWVELGGRPNDGPSR